jgi:hypothetical protein
VPRELRQPGGINDIDVGFDKLRHTFRNQINARSITAPIDSEVLPLNKAKPPKFIEHRHSKRSIAWTAGYGAKAIGPPRLLR